MGLIRNPGADGVTFLSSPPAPAGCGLCPAKSPQHALVLFGRRRVALQSFSLLEGVRQHLDEIFERLEVTLLRRCPDACLDKVVARDVDGIDPSMARRRLPRVGGSSASRARYRASQVMPAGSAKRPGSAPSSPAAASARRRKVSVKSAFSEAIKDRSSDAKATSPSFASARPSLARKPAFTAASSLGEKPLSASPAASTALSSLSPSSGSSVSAKRVRFQCVMRGSISGQAHAATGRAARARRRGISGRAAQWVWR